MSSVRKVDSIEKELTRRIVDAGYVVEEGLMFMFGIEHCNLVVPTFGNCFGNNPTAP